MYLVVTHGGQLQLQSCSLLLSRPATAFSKKQFMLGFKTVVALQSIDIGGHCHLSTGGFSSIAFWFASGVNSFSLFFMIKSKY